ncbi:response regulator [Variovorax sp. LjRoot84]|uniref:response regulator transcription factor n=1 Tax=Variovorax sp. LjRoot84 TaxID=3342340 RepID=UPI003ED16AFB
MLILDWRLPDVDGSDVVRWIREKLASSLPILFVAKRRKEEDMVEALTLGADDFMAKPIRVADLKARVQALLRRTGYRLEFIDQNGIESPYPMAGASE